MLGAGGAAPWSRRWSTAWRSWSPGALSFERWTGRAAPVQAMREAAAHEDLASRHEPRPSPSATGAACDGCRRGLAVDRSAANGWNGITSPRARPGGPRFLTDVIVELGLVAARARRGGDRAAPRPAAARPRASSSSRRAERGRAGAGGRRALRPRPPRPHRLPGRPGRGQARHPGGGQALPGRARAVRRRPRAARRDGRPGQRARGRRHRGDDRLRGAPGGRLARGHQRARRAPRRAWTTSSSRPASRRRRRAAPRSSSCASSAEDAPVIKLVNGDHRPGRRARRLRHPLRAATATRCASASASTACSRRRRPCPRAHGPGRHLRMKIMRRPRHRRAAHPAGRPRRARRSTASTIDLRVVDAAQRATARTIVMRILDQSEGDDRARAARHAADRRARALHEGLPPGPRRRARHRPDRLGQVDVALRARSTSSTRSRRTSSRSRTRSSTSSTGITQVQVNTSAGLTFATGLRSMMRADPDIIMVGEIRDRETAQIAIEAALTGHLVLSTLHTNDAPGAITRLIEMGIEPFLVGSRRRLRRRPAPRADCCARSASARTIAHRRGHARPTASTSASTSRPTSPSAARAAAAPATRAGSASTRSCGSPRDPHARRRARARRDASPRSRCTRA